MVVLDILSIFFMTFFVMVLLVSVVLMAGSPLLGLIYYRAFRNQAFLKSFFDKMRLKFWSRIVAYFSLCLTFALTGGVLYGLSSYLLYFILEAMVSDWFGLLHMI